MKTAKEILENISKEEICCPRCGFENIDIDGSELFCKCCGAVFIASETDKNFKLVGERMDEIEPIKGGDKDDRTS